MPERSFPSLVCLNDPSLPWCACFVRACRKVLSLPVLNQVKVCRIEPLSSGSGRPLFKLSCQTPQGSSTMLCRKVRQGARPGVKGGGGVLPQPCARRASRKVGCVRGGWGGGRQEDKGWSGAAFQGWGGGSRPPMKVCVCVCVCVEWDGGGRPSGPWLLLYMCGDLPITSVQSVTLAKCDLGKV